MALDQLDHHDQNVLEHVIKALNKWIYYKLLLMQTFRGILVCSLSRGTSNTSLLSRCCIMEGLSFLYIVKIVSLVGYFHKHAEAVKISLSGLTSDDRAIVINQVKTS